MPFGWLLGGSDAPSASSGPPETPVGRWALNALRGAVLPDTPIYYGNPQAESLATSACHTNGTSILKTPGQAKEKKNVNVTFHKSVQTPPKKSSRSGLPNRFPGKFPSPWTPKDPILSENIGRDIEDINKQFADSPIAIEKDKHLSSRFSNPLKSFSIKTLDSKPSVPPKEVTRPMRSARSGDVRQARTRHPTSTHEQPLAWDVNKGFEEVLQSIAKNNQYLQSLISEMQESLSQAEESHSDGYSLTGSDVTTNLDEPKSNSGKFWRSKFLDFKVLTEKVKDEQNHMEQALDKLRADVKHDVNDKAQNWKDRCELLKEELDKERRSSRSSAQMRESRELKRQLREAQNKVHAQEDVQKQLDIAELQIKDLQSQLSVKEPNGDLSKRLKSEDALTLSGSSPVSHPCVAARDTYVSSTSRRLARARALADSNKNPQPPVESPEFPRSVSPQIGTLPSDRRSDLETRTSHRRFGSRTNIIPVHEDKAPTIFNKTFERTAASPSFSPPAIPSKIDLSSPRPKFTSLDINLPTKAITLGKKEEAMSAIEPVVNEEEAKRRAQVREAAKRRLDARKAERMAEQAILRGTFVAAVAPSSSTTTKTTSSSSSSSFKKHSSITMRV